MSTKIKVAIGSFIGMIIGILFGGFVMKVLVKENYILIKRSFVGNEDIEDINIDSVTEDES